MTVILNHSPPQIGQCGIVLLFAGNAVQCCQCFQRIQPLPTRLTRRIVRFSCQCRIHPIAGQSSLGVEIQVGILPVLINDAFSGLQVLFLAGFFIEQRKGVTDCQVAFCPVLRHKRYIPRDEVVINVVQCALCNLQCLSIAGHLIPSVQTIDTVVLPPCVPLA